MPGKLQHNTTRLPAKPSVDYTKGGSDFRTPWHTSSLGKQYLSNKHLETAGRTAIGKAPRFDKSETCGPGPNMAQPSSFKRQMRSDRRTPATAHFGTGTRDDALKQYAVYTYKR